MKHAVFAGIGLSRKERLLADYFLSSLPEGTLAVKDQFYDADLSLNPYYPDFSLSEVSRLTEWRRPVLIISGKSSREEALERSKTLFEAGIGAVWQMPEEGMPVLFPPLEVPENRSPVYLIAAGNPAYSVMRQVFLFGGHSCRIDFRSSDELILELEETAVERPSHWPALIAADLDHEKIDISSFFYRLKRILNDHPEIHKKNTAMILKDFSRPGLDLKVMSSVLKPFAKKIFHPYEGLQASAEAVCASSETQIQSETFREIRHPRSLREILYGHEKKQKWIPASHGAEICPVPESCRKELLFSWIFSYLDSEEMRSGAVLRPDPGIDPGNLFHRI